MSALFCRGKSELRTAVVPSMQQKNAQMLKADAADVLPLL
jgi:hypothetical protein